MKKPFGFYDSVVQHISPHAWGLLEVLALRVDAAEPFHAQAVDQIRLFEQLRDAGLVTALDSTGSAWQLTGAGEAFATGMLNCWHLLLPRREQ